MKILIIDDELHNRLRLKQIIHKHLPTAQISMAEFGDDGLAAIKQQVPELVFLDMVLPVLDGKTILENIKADSRLRESVRVVLISGLVGEGQVSPLADGYLSKPFDPAQVRETLDRYRRE